MPLTHKRNKKFAENCSTRQIHRSYFSKTGINVHDSINLTESAVYILGVDAINNSVRTYD